MDPSPETTEVGPKRVKSYRDNLWATGVRHRVYEVPDICVMQRHDDRSDGLAQTETSCSVYDRYSMRLVSM